MLFNSFVFLGLFLPITYVVFWSLRTAEGRYRWLALTGYVFYGYWDPRFCVLMAFGTIVSYVAGLGFARYSDPVRDARVRRWCLVVPVTTDLLLLGFFKYAMFALRSLEAALHWAGVGATFPHWQIVLPIGISFYTFHTISYIVDCYRGAVRPTRRLSEFAAYVSLFSQLIAGPIVRFRQIAHDLEALGHADRTRWARLGISFFITGLVEKVLVADSLASMVNPALHHYATLSTGGAWLAMAGYALQLYFDFSGYSTMAVGLGYLFGLRIPQNFNSPYQALDPSDFWRRWHISLSTCLRDYLYIPLGGNRHGTVLTYRNLMITMLLGGLWHGANWTFVLWGAYHGVLLSIYRAWGAAWNRLPRVPRQLGMAFLTLLGWVLFRSTDFGMAAHLYRVMFVPTAGTAAAAPTWAAPLVFGAGMWALAGPNAFELHQDWRPRRRYVLAGAAALGVCVAFMLGGAATPFLYFQF